MRDRRRSIDPNGRPQPVDAGFCLLELVTTAAAVAVCLLLMLAGYPIRMAGATRSTRLKMQERQQQIEDAVKETHIRLKPDATEHGNTR